MKKSKSLKLESGEKFIQLPIPKTPNGNRYAITNHGRVISYTTTPQEGRFLRLGKIGKYRGASMGRKTFLVQRLVAKYFVKKTSASQRFVIHINFNNHNNHYKNLKWVNREDMEKHVRENPHALKRGNQKLTADKVRLIKQELQKGKTLKMIAQKFHVTDMTIHRIKTGENWGHIK